MAINFKNLMAAGIVALGTLAGAGSARAQSFPPNGNPGPFWEDLVPSPGGSEEMGRELLVALDGECDDALAALAHLRADPRVDAGRLGDLVGDERADRAAVDPADQLAGQPAVRQGVVAVPTADRPLGCGGPRREARSGLRREGLDALRVRRRSLQRAITCTPDHRQHQ